ncbi:M4 family metallopeptidase [uncultured Nocardioides sp.]|mgnify:CR=1 FL=1|uniref:M4 family metallopeptidase n=1 Tax=uncultured Nocardioides sp. TaxID=198441 RepID=UPI00263960AF|nr:M4 family metallopeptidase [uncultured Nocardioides sp.]HRD60412.1 M4 family metallopeptidase [Nocardioides sp.]
MKFLKQGVCLALLGAGLAAVPASLTTQAAATPSSVAGDQALVRELRGQADGTVSVRTNPATGEAGFVQASGGNADLLPDVAGNSVAKAGAKADSFVDSYGALLGAAPGELVRQDVSQDAAGYTASYAQIYQGLPVFGSMVKANLDSVGNLISVNGFAAPDIDVPTAARVPASTIGDRAIAFVKADPPTSEDGKHRADTSGLKASDAQLVVYRTGFVKGEAGTNALAWAIKVQNAAVNDQFIFDATTGKILNRYSLSSDALDRELDEATGTPDNVILTKVWEEGDEFPGTLNEDQQNLVNSSGESYWFFKNLFNRDSYDGAGAKRITVNNDPRIACPNANWNGATTNYCDGVTSDDVVAHEWGHAYTQFTDGLIYQFQSGALNESYSDVWGETLDLVNGREDEGETFNTKRPDNECDPTASPKLVMSITAPAAQAGPCTSAVATGFSQPFTTTPVTATVVAAADAADAAGPSTTDGCTAPFTNAAAVSGNWAFVDRGTCPFQNKINNAVAAGATGIVIGNNTIGVPPNVAGTAPAGFYGTAVTQADGTRFKTAGTAQVSVQAEDISTRTDSTRWLIGEKSEAFGGAIRDMWTPTCYGNPGKVTDAEYNCDLNNTDHGGVHGNSGVPNHAYALAVDGGSYNGQTITGLGLDKAANIWWKAQTSYLTPSSNFTEFADALDASCQTLTGVTTLKSLTATTTKAADTSPNAAPITAADCTQLGKVITAVQLRTPVTQCGFKPLLDKATPSLCGPGFTTTTVYKEDFEDGLAGWTPSQEVADVGGAPAGHGEPWTASTSAPGSHAGGIAYGPAPDEGQCDGSAEDFSSRDSITGPAIQVPTGSLTNLRLSFDHYVATEGTVDGGNVKMSVNGGEFTAIPPAAYVFNKPNAKLLTLAQGNTNPMQGQDAFTGTDGGEARGSWGTSQVDLAAAGVQPGQSVQLRFDIGRDGCGGVDGWYVDNVQVTYCQVVTTPPASSTVEAAAKPKQIQDGHGFKVKVKVTTAGGPAAGAVEIYKGSKLLGTGTLGADGKVTIEISKHKADQLKIGKNTLTAKYLGSATTTASQDSFTVTVKHKKKHHR